MDLLAAARDEEGEARVHLWVDAWEERMRTIHAEQRRAVLATRKALRDLRGLTADEAAGFSDNYIPRYYQDSAYNPFSN